MSVLYLLPILPPKDPTTEALAQEIDMLRGRFGGEVVYVNPNARLPRPLIPRLLFGWPMLARLRRLARAAEVVHFFNPDPFPFTFLTALGRPVIYTITSGVGTRRPNRAFLRRMAAVTVPDQRSLTQLREWGLTNAALQPPAVDAARFTHSPLPLGEDDTCHILVASAPWTAAQFASKGYEALLLAAQDDPALRLTLLWRGVLAHLIHQHIAMLNLDRRVTVIDRTVNVNEALGKVHAAALFATQPGLVKSFPHSLLDALAAGKPVLVSRAIPMSDYVEANGCGVVVEEVTPEAIAEAIQTLRQRYAELSRAAQIVGQRDFCPQNALDAMAAIYTRVVAAAAPPDQVGARE